MEQLEIANKDSVLGVLLLVFFCCACQTGEHEPTADEFLESLPHVHPSEITRFQHADSLYFSHLGYETVSLSGGTVIYDRDNTMLVKVNSDGQLVQLFARQGRGPGEVQDLGSLSQTSGGDIVGYDQQNHKIVRYSGEGNFLGELIPPSFEKGQLTKLYSVAGADHYVLRFSSFDYLMDKTKDPESFLVRYDARENEYGDTKRLQARPFARLVMDGKVRGGTQVSFSPRHLIANNPDSQTLYQYWTGSNQIAEISTEFDTLSTIPVDLPAQELSNAERDSIREENSAEQWDTLSELLPNSKVPVEKMKLDTDGRFWLKLNYRYNSDLWLVMGQDGTFHKIVHLPKESMLTHISEQHLGVRIDDITLALYEPID